MIAILYSGRAGRPLAQALVVAQALAFIATQQQSLAAESAVVEELKRLYETNRVAFQAQPTNAVAATQLARACFEWAEYAPTEDEREKLAREGIDAARRAIELQPGLAAGHYYLGLNLGQFARTKRWAALKVIGEMEREFKRAAELDAKIDYGGPDRALGLLYAQAPGWPVSIGNRSKARLHLGRAVELAPDFPENHLCLLEAYLKWDDRKSGAAAAKLRELWPGAKERFKGAAWALSWLDWEQRWSTIQKELQAGGRRRKTAD